MRITFYLFLSLVLSACAGLAQNEQSDDPRFEQWDDPLTAEEAGRIEAIEAEGRLIYRKDQFAARATDLLLGQIDFRDYPDFVGWVGYERGADFVVSFYERSDDGVSLVGDVVFGSEGSSVLELAPDRSLTDREISMLNARMVALEAGRSTCSDRFNTVVMPSSDTEASWTVYVLAATTQPGVILIGGHSRVTVSKATGDLLNVEQLSKSCLKLQHPGSVPDVPEGSILVFTHLVSPLPIPVYPYLSLLHEEAFAVSSERANWMIRGDEISMIEF